MERKGPPDHANKPTVDEAPQDGELYGRRNAAWEVAAALDSPAFSGQPQAPTPATGDDGDTIATTAFVQAAIAAALGEQPPTEPPIEPPIEPPGEVTFQEIDGGNNYYRDAGLTYCADAGWDDPSFFPIGVWLAAISLQEDVDRTLDLGINYMAPMAGGGPNGYADMQLVKDTPGLFLAQVISNNSVESMLDDAGPETVCINVVDEPEWWNKSDGKDIVTTFDGTNISTMANYKAAHPHICDGRAIWVGFTTPQYAYGPPSGGPATMEEALSKPLRDAGGTERIINVTAADFYFLSVWEEGGLKTAASIYQFWDQATGEPKADGVPLVTSGEIKFKLKTTGHPFEAGAAISVFYWGSVMNGHLVAYDDATGDVTMNVETGHLDDHGQADKIGDNCGVQVAMTFDQCHRPAHMGDCVDKLRPWQSDKFPAPIGQYPENGAPYTNQNFFVKPEAMQASVWSSIMHGARWLVYFNHSYGAVSGYITDNFAHPSFQQPHPGDTISIYDAAKATNHLVHQLAPVINARYAINYVSVTGDNKGGNTAGFNLPWPVGPNKTNGIGNHNISLASAFEVMSKYYEGPSDGVLVQNRFYVWCMYRGSAADQNIRAKFTVADKTAKSVTRILPAGPDIAVSNGQFEDVFATGNTVGIYRVNPS